MLAPRKDVGARLVVKLPMSHQPEQPGALPGTPAPDLTFSDSGWQGRDTVMAAAAADAATPTKTAAPKQVRLLPSLFPHRKPVVFFEYPAFLKESRHRREIRAGSGPRGESYSLPWQKGSSRAAKRLARHNCRRAATPRDARSPASELGLSVCHQFPMGGSWPWRGAAARNGLATSAATPPRTGLAEALLAPHGAASH